MPNRNDPKVYGFICPGCEMRYGDPQDKGYVDVLRCGNCYNKITMYEEKKRERQCAKSRFNYRKKKMDLKQQRTQTMF